MNEELSWVFDNKLENQYRRICLTVLAELSRKGSSNHRYVSEYDDHEIKMVFYEYLAHLSKCIFIPMSEILAVDKAIGQTLLPKMKLLSEELLSNDHSKIKYTSGICPKELRTYANWFLQTCK